VKNIYEVQSANKIKSTIIVVVFVVFVALTVYILSQALGYYWGYEAGGLGGVGLALIISGFISFGSYYFSDQIVLGISGAKEANRKAYFDFYTVAENLAIGAGLPKPKLFVLDDSAPNALLPDGIRSMLLFVPPPDFWINFQERNWKELLPMNFRMSEIMIPVFNQLLR